MKRAGYYRVFTLMSAPFYDQQAKYHAKAKEAEERAEKMKHDAFHREGWLRIAKAYRELAKRLER